MLQVVFTDPFSKGGPMAHFSVFFFGTRESLEQINQENSPFNPNQPAWP
jgi:hypothetical protein